MLQSEQTVIGERLHELQIAASSEKRQATIGDINFKSTEIVLLARRDQNYIVAIDEALAVLSEGTLRRPLRALVDRIDHCERHDARRRGRSASEPTCRETFLRSPS